jgi:hypothetical protein
MKLIAKQHNNWTFEFQGKKITFTLKPVALYLENDLFPLNPNCNNGLRWKICNKWISYKQIKKAITAAATLQ